MDLLSMQLNDLKNKYYHDGQFYPEEFHELARKALTYAGQKMAERVIEARREIEEHIISSLADELEMANQSLPFPMEEVQKIVENVRADL